MAIQRINVSKESKDSLQARVFCHRSSVRPGVIAQQFHGSSSFVKSLTIATCLETPRYSAMELIVRQIKVTDSNDEYFERTTCSIFHFVFR